jgi:hypothetical protein
VSYITSKFQPFEIFRNLQLLNNVPYIIDRHIDNLYHTQLFIPRWKQLKSWLYVPLTKLPIMQIAFIFIVLVKDLCVIFFVITAWTTLLKKTYLTYSGNLDVFQLLPETFLIPGRIQRDVVINVLRTSCKVPDISVRLSNQTSNPSAVSSPVLNCTNSLQWGKRCSVWTDRHDELRSLFSHLC